MITEDKIKIAIEKGYTCEPDTGRIYGPKKEIKAKNKDGYIIMSIRHIKKDYMIYGHQFVYYWMNKSLPKIIDHIDGNKSNNQITNLREVTRQQNGFNTKSKGAYKLKDKFMSQIALNNRSIYLGLYNTEEEAHQAYLDAKKIYHII